MISTKNRISGLADQWEETEGLNSKDRPAMSDWAEANYVLSAETSDIPGPWSNDYTPFLRQIMDRWSDVRSHPPLLTPGDEPRSLSVCCDLLAYNPSRVQIDCPEVRAQHRTPRLSAMARAVVESRLLFVSLVFGSVDFSVAACCCAFCAGSEELPAAANSANTKPRSTPSKTGFGRFPLSRE